MTAVTPIHDPGQYHPAANYAMILYMQNKPIEPGLLQVFRLFAGIRVTLAVLSVLAAIFSRGHPYFERSNFGPWSGLIDSGILLILLVWPRLPDRLGRFYLPLAILLATGGPLLTSLPLGNNAVPMEILAIASIAAQWQLMIVLFLPMILVSWQYSFRVTVFYIVSLLLYDVVIVSWPGLSAPQPFLAFGLVIFRSLFYLMIGYSISRLVDGQRQQKIHLEQANRQLVRYAVTLEQLAISQERNRLARELHDTLAHSLSGLAVQLEGIRSVWDTQIGTAQIMLDHALESTRQGLTETRRALQALRASPLDDLGLGLALRSLAETAAARAGCKLKGKITEPFPRLPSDVEQGIYRIAQEALENAVRHAQAVTMTVQLFCEDEKTVLVIMDDGVGFGNDYSESTEHYGLRGMRERAQMLHARFFMDSQPGKGTMIRLEWGDEQ